MSHCRKCQKRMENLEAGLVESAEEEALPNAPLAPAIQLLDQKVAPSGENRSDSDRQKRKRPARAV